jgi:hypothetical protein
MSTNQQPTQENTKGIEMFLFGVGVILAWPALVLGAVARWQIKQHTTEHYPYWIAGALGGIGALWLATHSNPYPFLLTTLHDIVPLVFHTSTSTLTRFVLDALPLWERSILVFPLFVVLLEIFGTRSLQATLLAKERQRRAMQARKSQRAAGKAANAPPIIKKKGVFGALIDDLNN